MFRFETYSANSLVQTSRVLVELCAGLSPWAGYRSRTCRAALLAEAGENEAFDPIEENGSKTWPFSHQPCKVNFAEQLSVLGRMENDTEPNGRFWFCF